MRNHQKTGNNPHVLYTTQKTAKKAATLRGPYELMKTKMTHVYIQYKKTAKKKLIQKGYSSHINDRDNTRIYSHKNGKKGSDTEGSL